MIIILDLLVFLTSYTRWNQLHEFKTLRLVAVNMNLPPTNEPGRDPFIGCTIEQWILWDENIVISASWLLHKPGLERPSAENIHLLLSPI